MAEQTTTPVAAESKVSAEGETRSAELVAEPAVAEEKPGESGPVATSGVAEVPETNTNSESTTDMAGAPAENTIDGAGDDADATSSANIKATTNGTPTAQKITNGKRKSNAGVAEHKKKTPAKKKKPAPELRLNVVPGEMYMVAMRGYQPWPVVICDEAMLPESLLSKRPVSARRIDGTYRDDFREGGKNAKDRRYPVMFLGTNEFAWQVNTELLPFHIEEVKQEVKAGQGKKNKALWEAYQIAAEGHDIEYFKTMLSAHEAALAEDAEQREEKERAKKEKAEKAAKRKSAAADDLDDVEMKDDEVAPSTKKAKASKKRKKDTESDGENEKPAKTPKTKLKLTNKTPKDTSAAKTKKEPKSAKKVSDDEESAQPEEAPMTEEERLAKREKQVLYLRHRLQKGFLSRDQAPKDEDMANMSDYLKQLDALEDLEADIIKKTKVHKVLRAIIKLGIIPREEEFEFKKRSNDLLNKWGSALAADPDTTTTTTAAESATNGVKHEYEPKSDSAKDEALADSKEAPSVPTGTHDKDEDSDVKMTDIAHPAKTEIESAEATKENGSDAVA